MRARLCGDRGPVSRGERPERAQARARARRRDAGGGRGRSACRRVHAGRGQARGGRLRPRREAPGPADGEIDSRPACGAVAARCRRRAGDCNLPHQLAGAGARGGCLADSADEGARQLASVPAGPVVIAFLRGRILDKQPNRIVVDVNGVGYDLSVPLSTFYGLGDVGGEIALRVHTHVREDALSLYGFATRLEQDLFERLIGVSGIGPKVGLAVLSGIEPMDLIRAIERGDLARLTAIPGVGKKTSERIVLELKDRLPRGKVAAIAAGETAPEAPALRDDVVSALVNLGYHRPLAEHAAEAAIKTLASAPDAGFERMLKQALRELAK